MKHLLTALILLVIIQAAEAQAEEKLSCGRFEVEAGYPGGIKALQEHFKNNLVYPVSAIKDRAEGAVTIQYTIDKQGCVALHKVLGNPRADLQQEALRLLYTMKQWAPATHNGKKVKAYRVATIYFKLNGCIEALYLPKQEVFTPDKS